MVRPIFRAWLEPFRDVGASSLTIRSAGGTDHRTFSAVGLPEFQFIQDPAEYQTRTHHSNMDVYDHIQPADLKQAAAIVASFAYHARSGTRCCRANPCHPLNRRRDRANNRARKQSEQGGEEIRHSIKRQVDRLVHKG